MNAVSWLPLAAGRGFAQPLIDNFALQSTPPSLPLSFGTSHVKTFLRDLLTADLSSIRSSLSRSRARAPRRLGKSALEE